ncbi:MAG: nucleoside kinase [Oscillospiraceae bacterium]|nr:nucleoside kinase [Oscillospiraceae bacterium]
MNEVSVQEINKLAHDTPELFVIDAEAAYDKQLRTLANDICRHAKEHPITLIAGPSGSGKTTTACRLEQILDAAGFESHTLSMDNYYSDGSKNRGIVDQFGKQDYESPLRLDTDLLHSQLKSLARGDTVELPEFDFAAQKQRKSGKILHRKPNELIIMEGIHALNPEVTGDTHEIANRIYLSVRTRITMGDDRLHPSLIRFARRLIRDHRTRGRLPAESCEMLSSISRGENLYIMPYKHFADYELDTFMGYELSIYQPMLLETVRQLAETAAAESGVPMLLKFLEALTPMEPTWIPDQSLVREFIGGSLFTS